MTTFNPGLYTDGFDSEKSATDAYDYNQIVDRAIERAAKFAARNKFEEERGAIVDEVKAAVKDVVEDGRREIERSNELSKFADVAASALGQMDFGGNSGLDFMANNTNDYSATDAVAMGVPVDKANWLSDPANYTEWSSDMPINKSTFGTYDF